MMKDKSEQGKLLGNAMSLNVIERIIVGILQQTSFSKKIKVVDRWLSGLAQQALRVEHTISRATRCERKLLVDSGASMHCVGEESLTSSEKATAQPLSEPIPISTANGVITVTHYATIYVASF